MKRREMELLELIKGRRSVRRYKPTPVKEEDLNLILEAGRWAPSWANTQCWQFIVVRDPDVKLRLAQTCPPGKRWVATVRDAPVVVVACAELGKSGYYGGEPVTNKGDWFMFDAALAAQNMVLMAHSLGLGTVHIGYFDAEKAGEILKVPEGIVVVELIPMGYPAEEPKSPRRKELSEMVFYDRYGQVRRADWSVA
jgi:nitroreductase